MDKLPKQQIKKIKCEHCRGEIGENHVRFSGGFLGSPMGFYATCPHCRRETSIKNFKRVS